MHSSFNQAAVRLVNFPLIDPVDVDKVGIDIVGN